MKKFLIFTSFISIIYSKTSFAYDIINNDTTNFSIDINSSNYLLYNEKNFKTKSLNEINTNLSKTINNYTFGIFSSTTITPKTTYMKKNNILSELYLYTENNYGRIELGKAKNTSSKINTSSNNIGISDINYISGLDYLLNNNNKIFSLSNSIISDNNSFKINYISPNLNKFQIATSITPNIKNDNLQETNFGKIKTGFTSLVKYSYEKEYNIKLVLSYGHFKKSLEINNINNETNLNEYSISTLYYKNGWEIISSYKNIVEKFNNTKNIGYIIGNSIAYEIASINIGLSNNYLNLPNNFNNKNDKFNIFLLSGKYKYNEFLSLSTGTGITSHKTENKNYIHRPIILSALHINF